jgi:hypothetical protein
VYHRVPDQLPNRVKAEFHQYPSPVGIDRRNGYIHQRGDFLAALTFRQKSNYFTFPLT